MQLFICCVHVYSAVITVERRKLLFETVLLRVSKWPVCVCVHVVFFTLYHHDKYGYLLYIHISVSV